MKKIFRTLMTVGALMGFAPFGQAASFGALGGSSQPPSFTGGAYATPPAYDTGQPPLPGAGAEGVYPTSPDMAGPFVPGYQANPRLYLPMDPGNGLPPPQLQLWTFGQMNSGTDPYNPMGLSTPYMFVPWSTPLSAWTNAQTWNWWRERSGALPRNW